MSDRAKAPSSPPDATQVALARARQRKDLEGRILDSLVLLSEFPLVRSPAHSAASPAPSDIVAFKAHVRLLQPSDYADLLEERNVNGLCGYALCPQPRRHTGPGGEWKITASGDIVKRKHIEMWCSHSCARRALYVQIQLNETAVWERTGIPDIQIHLLGDDDVGRADARRRDDAQLEQQRHAARNAAALALDRGRRGAASNADHVMVTIKEKATQTPPSPATSVPATEDAHLLVEGHKIQLPFRPRQPG